MENNINQELVDRINRIVIPADIANMNVPVIPLGASVVIKEVKSKERKSAGGLLLAETMVTNELTGRLIAVGPECKPYLRKGLLVAYNSLANMQAYINGDNYIMCHESSVFYILADEEIVVDQAPLSSQAIKKIEKAKKQQEIYNRVHEAQLNAEDIRVEFKKKITRKEPKKKINPTTKRRTSK
jgi:co-chaperonin GroES (HSP10)